MFWLAAIIIAGTSTYAISRLVGPLLIGTLIGVPLLIVVVTFAAFDKLVGIDAFMNRSWQFFSGASTPDNVWGCHGGGMSDPFGYLIAALLIWVLLMILCVVNAILGIAAVIGIPVGAVGSIFCCLGACLEGSKKTTPDSDTGFRSSAAASLLILTTSLGCLMLAGLCLRAVHGISTGVFICN